MSDAELVKERIIKRIEDYTPIFVRDSLWEKEVANLIRRVRASDE
jgi:hypothetical protein